MDYQIKGLGTTCAATGAPLKAGDVCYSALLEKGSEWVRIDYSSAAWSGPPEGAIGYWRTQVPLQGMAKRRTLSTEELFQHFEQLCEDGNPAEEPFRYVLALLLLQRKRLRISSTRSEGSNSFLELTGSQGEGPLEVREQPLTEGDIQALQQSICDRLMTDRQ